MIPSICLKTSLQYHTYFQLKPLIYPSQSVPSRFIHSQDNSARLYVASRQSLEVPRAIIEVEENMVAEVAAKVRPIQYSSADRD